MSGGVFIVFEGGDGVGKSTQVERLCGWLGESGREVVRTFEPGDTRAGALIRAIVLDPATGDLSARAEALLYAADKAHHVHAVVGPALARGAVVVCDRYVDSMLAYQGAGRALELSDLERLASWATDGLQPDLTVLLDVDPGRAVHGKSVKDRLEAVGDSFHERARHYFLQLAGRAPERYLVLDARLSRDEISGRVLERVRQLLSQPSGTLEPR